MSYCHFSVVARGKIELMLKQKKSHQEIAKELGCHRTSIGREIRRNRCGYRYDGQTAHDAYKTRRHACRPTRKLEYEPLRKYVIDKIAQEEWGPELIAGRLRLDYPEDSRMRVCHETIYQALYQDYARMGCFVAFLPQARPKRRKRGQGKTRRCKNIPNRIGIEKRPQHVEQRLEIGHWEGDTVVGKNNDGFIVTLVERHSRLLFAVKTETKQAQEIQQAVVNALLDRPTSWVKTITFDNGTEFAQHEKMTENLGVQVYFADPYSAYQRGSNEQVNGLIRRYLPKGSPFCNLSQGKLDRIVEQINNRPRKCLAYRTPNEIFQAQRQQLLCALRT